MIVDSLKEAFDKNTKPDHMVAVGLKRATGKTDELSTNTLVKIFMSNTTTRGLSTIFKIAPGIQFII